MLKYESINQFQYCFSIHLIYYDITYKKLPTNITNIQQATPNNTLLFVSKQRIYILAPLSMRTNWMIQMQHMKYENRLALLSKQIENVLYGY